MHHNPNTHPERPTSGSDEPLVEVLVKAPPGDDQGFSEFRIWPEDPNQDANRLPPYLESRLCVNPTLNGNLNAVVSGQ